jgi:probable addiction module antidote protein
MEQIMPDKITPYDPAEDLISADGIAFFMSEAFKTEDPAFIAHALGVVARAKGMKRIAEQTGLSREQLYRSLSESGNPTLKSTVAVLKALGVRMSIEVPETS